MRLADSVSRLTSLLALMGQIAILLNLPALLVGAAEGSPPFSRTLTRRPIKAMRSVHVEAKEVQHRVQARCG